MNYETGKVWTKRKRRNKGTQKAINKGKKRGNDALDTQRDQLFALTLFWLEKLIWNELLKYVTVLPTRSLTVSLKQFAVTCFYTKPVAQMLCGCRRNSWRSHTLDVRLGSVQFISVDGIEPS